MYLRPIMEHSACIAFYLMNDKETKKFKKKRKSPIKMNYDDIHTYHQVTIKGLEWIGMHKRTKNIASLLGIPTTMTRLYCLALRLQRHMSRMDKDNPLYIAFNPPSGVKAFSKLSLTSRFFCWKDLLTKYKYFGDETTLSYSELLNKLDKRINEILVDDLHKTLMSKCILPTARVNKKRMKRINEKGKVTSADKCIFIRNNFLRKHAVAWRLNSFHLRKTCPICGNEFYRSHINKCDFIHKYPYNKIIKVKDILLYNKDKEVYKDRLPGTYNILDSLLNHQNYYAFGRFVMEIKKSTNEI